MNMVIDIGNTLQKVAVFSENDEIIRLFSRKQLDIPFFEHLFEEYDLRQAIVSSVGKKAGLFTTSRKSSFDFKTL